MTENRNCCNAYENSNMRNVTGDTLRPGGFRLTERGVLFCGLSSGDSVLDLGCGCGSTVAYLNKSYGIKAVGVDPSEKLIEEAKRRCNSDGFISARGEKLPFDDESFHAVFAECTLSLMDDLDRTLHEVYRVLRKDGWFIITDVYAKNPAFIHELERFSMNSCMRGLHDIMVLEMKLTDMGFQKELFEECSDLLKELLVKIGFAYGSMADFWNAATDHCMDGCQFQEVLKRCRPGYFLMVVRKGEKNHERHSLSNV